MRLSTMVAAALGVLMATGSGAMAQPPADDTVQCWLVETQADGSRVSLATALGAACAVQMELRLPSSTLRANESILPSWSIQLLSANRTTNELRMPLKLTPQPASADADAQVPSMFMRACTSRERCTPAFKSSFTSYEIAGNLSDSGPQIFEPRYGLVIPTPGAYILAVQAEIPDATNTSISYVYSTFLTANVAAKTQADWKADKKTTYCRASDELPAVLALDEQSSVGFSDRCPISVTVDSANDVQVGSPIDFSWSAAVRPANASDDSVTLRLPSPLVMVDVNDQKAEIVHSVLKICLPGVLCDEYTPESSLMPLREGGGHFFGNFSDSGIATFSVSGVRFPSPGLYNGLAQIVLSGVPSYGRLDFTTHFQVVVKANSTSSTAQQQSFVADGTTEYCCATAMDAQQVTAQADPSQVMAMGKGSECPYSLEVTLSATSTPIHKGLYVNWTVAPRASYSNATFGGFPVMDSSTIDAVVYYCDDIRCSPFVGNKTVVDHTTARNLTSGSPATFTSSAIKLPSAGNYTIGVRAMMPNGQFALETTVLSVVTGTAGNPTTVKDSSKHSSHATAIALSIVGVIALVAIVIGFVWGRNRRQQRRMKATTVHLAGRGNRARANTHELPTLPNSDQTRHSSFYSDESGSFVYIKAEPSPGADAQDTPMSLSYDPYSRPSFVEMSMESDLSFRASEGARSDKCLCVVCRPTFIHDGKTTYCYVLSEDISVQRPSSDAKNVLQQAKGAKCPLQLTVDVPDKLRKSSPIDVRYTALFDDSSKDPAIEFPFPVKAVAVPAYAASNSTTSGSGSSNGSSASGKYDIAVSEVVICDWGKCDLFTQPDGTKYSSVNHAGKFNNKAAVFGTKELVIPRDGKYTGYVHAAVALAGDKRIDFVTFFPVQIGDPAGTAPTSGISYDGKTTYCWTSKSSSPFDSRIEQVDTLRTDKNCPATMKATVSKKQVAANEEFDVQWSVQVDSSLKDGSALLAEVSTDDYVRDPSTDQYSIVPVSVLSGCKAEQNAKCSSYSGGDSKTFDITKVSNRNLTDGMTSYETKPKFSEPGKYVLISRVAMKATDGGRIDMAVYSEVSVAANDSSSSGSTYVYVGLAIGAVILLAGLVACVVMKRRAKARLKNIPFRQPGVPIEGDVIVGHNDHVSHHTNGSANFLGVKSPSRAAPPPYPQHMYTGDQRDDSFSLDPFGRNSFTNMPNEPQQHHQTYGQHGMPLQYAGQGYPIGMAGVGHQPPPYQHDPELDDDESWEYDSNRSRGVDDDFSDYSSVRGTFQVQSVGVDDSQHMPVLEDRDRRYH
ncbi:TPA: hypothetical protein N0F65_010360 [Lagenidium giganteum]|uniref:Uncharacterized protein n=1 Tax=Lagenidium giganteum TaxID=4803 RepID=A0AAV2Z8H2_9STRA|nr:TPA: hypothetical protein N0F65_010360 [Lagenidium giganteum]